MIYSQNVMFREIKTPVDSRTLTRVAKEEHAKLMKPVDDKYYEDDSSCKDRYVPQNERPK
jgi:hypothetical protein